MNGCYGAPGIPLSLFAAHSLARARSAGTPIVGFGYSLREIYVSTSAVYYHCESRVGQFD